jgi:hypothetical protein
MSRYRWQVVGIEDNPTSTLVRVFEDDGEVEADHVGHVVELLPTAVDWSMVDTDSTVTIEIRRSKGEPSG